MWNRLKKYISKIETHLRENPDGTDWASLKKDMLVQISFFQHERLVHLLVTLTFALLMVMFLALIL